MDYLPKVCFIEAPEKYEGCPNEIGGGLDPLRETERVTTSTGEVTETTRNVTGEVTTRKYRLSPEEMLEEAGSMRRVTPFAVFFVLGAGALLVVKQMSPEQAGSLPLFWLSYAVTVVGLLGVLAISIRELVRTLRRTRKARLS